jgi:predicted kinase
MRSSRVARSSLRRSLEGTVGDVLLLINGAPGVGKSTLAHRYADEHPLALIIDIDSIRTRLGQWAKFEQSRLVARDLALALAHAHLLNGHDVIVPQYLGRPEYRERLRLLAGETDVPFVEVLLTDDAARITRRFRTRRADYASTGAEHPEGDLSDEAVATEVSVANDGLLRDATGRGVLVISATGGPDKLYLALCESLAALH